MRVCPVVNLRARSDYYSTNESRCAHGPEYPVIKNEEVRYDVIMMANGVMTSNPMNMWKA